MGAAEFMVFGYGADAKKAFSDLVDDARYEHGHGGYTGTIAEKDEFKKFKLPKEMESEQFMNVMRLLDAAHCGDEQFEDQKYAEWIADVNAAQDTKWGPAACVEITGRAAGEVRDRRKMEPGVRIWVFFGWASS